MKHRAIHRYSLLRRGSDLLHWHSWHRRRHTTQRYSHSTPIVVSMLLPVMSVILIFAGRSIRKLQASGRSIAILLSVLGIIASPSGFIINVFILYLLLSSKGRMVFSQEYRAVIEQTLISSTSYLGSLKLCCISRSSNSDWSRIDLHHGFVLVTLVILLSRRAIYQSHLEPSCYPANSLKMCLSNKPGYEKRRTRLSPPFRFVLREEKRND